MLALTFAACGDDGSVTTEDGTGTGTGTGSATGTGTGTGARPVNVQTIKPGTLTVCTDVPYAPFEFEEGGQVVGIDADLMRAIANDLGLKAEFRDTDFDGIFAALAAGDCDVVASSVTITEERKQNMLFTDGYYEINQSLLVRKADEARYRDLPDLRGKVVGVQSGTTGADFAEARKGEAGYQVREFTGADELFTALRVGQVDAALQDFPVNSYNAATSKQTVVTKVFTETEKEQYGFAIARGKEQLRDAVNKALGEVRESGEYDRILEKYLGTAEQQ